MCAHGLGVGIYLIVCGIASKVPNMLKSCCVRVFPLMVIAKKRTRYELLEHTPTQPVEKICNNTRRSLVYRVQGSTRVCKYFSILVGQGGGGVCWFCIVSLGEHHLCYIALPDFRANNSGASEPNSALTNIVLSIVGCVRWVIVTSNEMLVVRFKRLQLACDASGVRRVGTSHGFEMECAPCKVVRHCTNVVIFDCLLRFRPCFPPVSRGLSLRFFFFVTCADADRCERPED